MPDEFSDVLSYVAHEHYRLREPLTDRQVTETWIHGLVAATKLTYGHAKVWSGKYTRPLPYVIEGPCPLGHRTENQYDDARIRLVTRQGGWWSYDPESPCPKCTANDIRVWLATCPRCLAGEDSERHFPFHSPLDLANGYDIDHSDKPNDFEYVEIDGGGFDASPLAWIMREFVKLGEVAAARWWSEHTDEAAAEWQGSRIIREADRQRFISERLAWTQRVLDAAPVKKKGSAAPKRAMTPEATADWLDAQEIPLLGEKATWERAKNLPGCPTQAVIFAGVKVRKARTT